jgi:hypothetical protein
MLGLLVLEDSLDLSQVDKVNQALDQVDRSAPTASDR